MIDIKEKKMIEFLEWLFIKFLLPKHKFKESMLIKTAQSDIVYSVTRCFYDLDLEPVVYIESLDGTIKGYITGKNINEYKEFKNVPKGTPVYN